MVENKNIFLVNTKTSIGYSSRPGNGGAHYPARPDSERHAKFIQQKLQDSYERSSVQKQAAAIRYKSGTYLEFSSSPGYDLSLKNLENNTHGIKLLNVREETLVSDETDNSDDNKIVKATVYVPKGKEPVFLKKIEDFLDPEKRTSGGNPKNKDFVTSIEEIHLALLDSFWIGNIGDMPDAEPEWCEVWLRYLATKDELQTKENKTEVVNDFNICCESLNIKYDEKEILFPERLVKLIYVNKSQLKNLIEMCDYIAEFRRAPERVQFFEELSGEDQQEWIDDLLERTSFNESTSTVCLLDTGLTVNHPLISPAITELDTIQTVDTEWEASDHAGHGTQMAGVAIYHDLKEKLVSNDPIQIDHKIESVKILPPIGENQVELYGAITENAVYLSEIENPKADRAICMAVTSSDYNTEDGSPTSWSAAVDNITSGADGSNTRRLFLVSAGNVFTGELQDNPYPEGTISHSVENPGQSWNALTVGAYCNNIDLESPYYQNYQPIADVGELSPYSSTSVYWGNKWPIKPEILLDGGNMITNGLDVSECEDLELLTTSKDFLRRPLTTIGGTSSATAQASWFAAQIYSEYPGVWPETVRALMIHSATWTDKMVNQFCIEDKKTKGRNQLLRSCGYGIPNLEKAIECKNNSVNLVIESEIQPFDNTKMNEMHIHEIPWPKEILQELGEIEAKLKVTLSYFIEPGPGEVGWKNKYRYPSAGLRFDVISSDESLEEFEKRINYKMRDENTTIDTKSRDWYLGTNNRDVGSVHSDFCEAPAVALCDANYIAVYPVIGWWRERSYLGKNNSKMRYSLVVSIETPETEIDLYTSIITQISLEQGIEIDIDTRI